MLARCMQSDDNGIRHEFKNITPVKALQHVDLEINIDNCLLQIGDVEKSSNEWFYTISLTTEPINISGIMLTLIVYSQIGTDSIPEFDYVIKQINDTVGSFKPADQDIDNELRNLASGLLEQALSDPQVERWIMTLHKSANE